MPPDDILTLGSTSDARTPNIDRVTEFARVEDVPGGVIQLEVGPQRSAGEMASCGGGHSLCAQQNDAFQLSSTFLPLELVLDRTPPKLVIAGNEDGRLSI